MIKAKYIYIYNQYHDCQQSGSIPASIASKLLHTSRPQPSPMRSLRHLKDYQWNPTLKPSNHVCSVRDTIPNMSPCAASVLQAVPRENRISARLMVDSDTTHKANSDETYAGSCRAIRQVKGDNTCRWHMNEKPKWGDKNNRPTDDLSSCRL